MTTAHDGQPQTKTQSGPEADRDLLRCELTLTVDGSEHQVPGGQIKSLSLSLFSHGFSGEIEFVLADDHALRGASFDTLYEAFIGDGLIAIRLLTETPLLDDLRAGAAAPLQLQGLVSERSVSEYSVGKSPGPARLRRYYVRFLDCASLLWTQHFPCQLYTEKSLRQVIEDQRGARVELSYDWELLDEKLPHVFLGHEPGAGAASFYDFVLWLASTRGGFFTYDYEKNRYRLTGEKPPAGAQTKVHRDDVASLRMQLPVLPRHGVRVRNAHTEQARTTAVPQAITKRQLAGIEQDYLLRTPLPAQFNGRVTQERERLNAAPGPLLLVTMRRWPTSPLCPGASCPLSDADGFLLEGTVLPAAFKGATTRVESVQLGAEALHPGLDDGYGAESAAFRIRGTVRLLHDSAQQPPALDFLPPVYPRLLEGRIVSEEGAEEDETFHIFEDEETSVEFYRVEIPLFQNQRIRIEVQPTLHSGHFFFPPYKHARVLVAVDLERAWLVRYLDWRPEGRLPKDTQGNHLLIGKKPESGVSLRHVYEEGTPILRLKRTHEKDTQLLEINEGQLLIRVKEEEAEGADKPLVCLIQLDKHKGGVVTVENKQAGLTQIVSLDGTSVVIKVKGDKDESTITQTADAVVIKSKSFRVDAETITCRSSGATDHQAQGALSVASQGDLTIDGSANLSLSAATNLSGKAASVQLGAQNSLSVAGPGASFTAEAGTATLQGGNVKLAGDGELKAEGGVVSLAASGMFKAEAVGVMTVKGSITNIQGSLVKLG
jgi:hypothetical protein